MFSFLGMSAHFLGFLVLAYIVNSLGSSLLCCLVAAIHLFGGASLLAAMPLGHMEVLTYLVSCVLEVGVLGTMLRKRKAERSH